MKIKQFGETGKADFTLKLIKSYGCYRLIATDKDGEEYSLVEVDSKTSEIKKCEDSLEDYI